MNSTKALTPSIAIALLLALILPTVPCPFKFSNPAALASFTNLAS